MSTLPADTSQTPHRERILGILALVCIALALVVTAIPGVFTIDEDNYLVNIVALRAGRVSLPGTEGLPPTRELLAFDPAADERGPVTTPVVSTAPPLYAPIALLPSFFGWYGLVALNAVSLVVAAACAFALAQRLTRSRPAPYIAALAVLFAGYSAEYAQGVWPHMLSMALLFGAYCVSIRAQDHGRFRLAALAGLLAGVSCGVRFPNALSAAMIGLGLILFSTRRVRLVLGYGAGLSVPLACASLLNHARLGIWNPISKGGGYLQAGEAYASRGRDALRCAVARIVDFAAQAPLVGHAARVHPYMHRSDLTGAYLIGGAVKKGWLQSMPWVALSLLVLVLAWRRSDRSAQVRCLRTAALVVFATLGTVAYSGSTRVDGYCFNQRYFVDLLPFVVIALIVAVDDLAWSLGALAAGAGLAMLVLVVAFLLPPDAVFRQYALTKVPLVLAIALLAANAVRGRRYGPLAMNVTLAASLVWAAGVHLADDLVASRKLREFNAQRLASAAPLVVAPAVVFAFWGGKDAFGPLALNRDVLIVD